MLFRKKIPCYVLVFDQVEIIQKSLDFLTKYADRLDLIIIENPSSNTPKIKKIIDRFGKKGLIKKYYLYDENITNNAMSSLLKQDLEKLKKTKYFMITDGDITCDDPAWLDEELRIMKHPEVFSCGVTLDKSNLPLKTFPNAKDWIPPDHQEYPDYYEVITGSHLQMVRGKEFYDFVAWQEKTNAHIVDGTMHEYCYKILGRRWARTKNAVAYHWTWDLYADKNHPYTKLKTDKSFKDTWHHKRQSGYKLTEY